MREVVSSIPAGPTPRVFKELTRKCCLCHFIRKWLDFQVFSDKDYKLKTLVHKTLWDVNDPTVTRFNKSRARSSWCCGKTPVSRKSRNFTGHFRVTQFPLYLKNGEDLSRKTSQSFFFLKDRLSKTSGWQFHKRLFGPEKFSGLSRNGPLA